MCGADTATDDTDAQVKGVTTIRETCRFGTVASWQHCIDCNIIVSSKLNLHHVSSVNISAAMVFLYKQVFSIRGKWKLVSVSHFQHWQCGKCVECVFSVLGVCSSCLECVLRAWTVASWHASKQSQHYQCWTV